MPILPKVQPVSLTFQPDGTAYSELFDDVYFSREGGADETRHVFIEGNRLPERWARLGPSENFVIVELGFGTGLNFSETLRTWQKSSSTRPSGGTRPWLHFFSCEKHPIPKRDLERFYREFFAASETPTEWLAQYPEFFTPGIHSIRLWDPRVVLNLFLGDVEDFLSEVGDSLKNRVDAWYFDGFTPGKNPALWSNSVFRSMRGLLHADSTFATYSVSRQAKDQAAQAGFKLEKRPGFGRKREMLAGISSDAPAKKAARVAQHVAIIGAGLAGSALAYELTQRDVKVTLIERRSEIATEASGNPSALYMPHLSAVENTLNHYSMLAWPFLLRILQTFGPRVVGEQSEIIKIFSLAEEAEAWRKGIARLGLAETLIELEPDDQKSSPREPLQLREDLPAIRLKFTGWIEPRSLARAYTETVYRLILQTEALRFSHTSEGQIELFSDRQNLGAFDAVVWANASDITRFTEFSDLPVRPLKGQVLTLPPQSTVRTPPIPLSFDGYLAPTANGGFSLGASFDHARLDAELDRPVQRSLIEKYVLATGRPLEVSDADLSHGRVGFRCTSHDQLPLVGPLPIVERYLEASKRPRFAWKSLAKYPDDMNYAQLYAFTGFGARGVCHIPLAAHALASQICAQPSPLEDSIAHAFHPARFLLRDLKRGRL